MLENIRKYTWLMAAVFILLAAGLIFTLQESNASLGGSMDGSPPALEAYDSSYSEKQVGRDGNRALELARQLGMQDLLILTGGFQEPDPNKFLATRLIIRKEAENHGIYPSREDIEKHIKENVFADEKGEFNQEQYTAFIDRVQNRMGLGENDLEKLFADHLRLQSLRELIAIGIEPSRSMETSMLQDRQQQLTVDKVEFKLADYLSKVSPTDEEIEQYWKEHTDSYMSEEKRKISYILAKPDYSSLEEETEENKEELKAKRTEIDRKLGENADLFWEAVYDEKVVDFVGTAQKYGFTVETADFFSATTAPAPIKLPLRGMRGKTVTSDIFEMSPSDEPQELLSNVLPAGSQNQWFIYTLDGIKKPEPLEFADAKEDAKKDLIDEKAREIMSDDAKKAHETIAKAVTDGTKFQEAVSAGGYETVKLGPFSARDSLPQDSNARTIFFNARRINPGNITEPVSEPEQNPNRILILHVDKRELVKSESFEQQVDSSISGAKSRFGYILFQNWLNEKYERHIKILGRN